MPIFVLKLIELEPILDPGPFDRAPQALQVCCRCPAAGTALPIDRRTVPFFAC